MSPTEKLGHDQVFHILRSPVRRGIIRILGENPQLSFTELRKTFPSISVGTLYYHIDLLSQMITQNSAKKYVLTEEGRRIYGEILRSEEAMIPVKASVEAQSTRTSIVPFLLMFRLFSDVSLRPAKYVVLPFAVYLGVAYLSWSSHSIQLLFFFISVSAASPSLVALSAAVSLLGVYSMLNGLSILFFHRRESNSALLIATSVGFVPLMLYPAALLLVANTIGQAWLAHSYVNIVLIIATQILSFLLLSAGLSQAKGLRMDRSALITLASVYLNMALLYFLGYVEL